MASEISCPLTFASPPRLVRPLSLAAGDSQEDEDEGKTVELVSQEGDSFQVERKVAKMSELVKTMVSGESLFRARVTFASIARAASTVPGSPDRHHHHHHHHSMVHTSTLPAPRSVFLSRRADDDDEQQEIPLPNVKSEILGKVIEFCRHYNEDPMTEIEKPLKSANMHEVVQEW